MRVADELRGSSASLIWAANRSSTGKDRFSVITFSRARLPAYCLTSRRRRLFFSIELFLAMD